MHMKRPAYIAMLTKRRAAVDAIADGLREYLGSEIDAELETMASKPEPDRQTMIARMTEELMEATANVQMIEAQSQHIADMLANMDPQLAAVLKPFEGIIDGMIRPMFEKQYTAACRHRQEIQEELTAFESAGGD